MRDDDAFFFETDERGHTCTVCAFRGSINTLVERRRRFAQRGRTLGAHTRARDARVGPHIMAASATSRAERTPLLASGDEGMRASSSGGGWRRFALGTGTLGVIAACAALATTPASTNVGLKTLGISTSLPLDKRGGALHTASTRPVAGGALDEPKVLSSRVFTSNHRLSLLRSHHFELADPPAPHRA